MHGMLETHITHLRKLARITECDRGCHHRHLQAASDSKLLARTLRCSLVKRCCWPDVNSSDSLLRGTKHVKQSI